ncbi:MAG: lipoprotein [Pseudomonadota bacterium]
MSTGVILSACGMKGALVLPEKTNAQHSNTFEKILG